ncbi:unnamed protein product [Cercopithifilaria johnstoni]|uniref:Uncharacterized protein n=1 Tax=Cercopithifilaria johnstoni TaxID=2874296 RepID=A0A8J2LVZ7_9BILA|nr:unnamed protein product [Cercopithifilaria johnstoni]
MKRRSVTFTNSPPEIIENGNDNHNICSPLSTGNIFFRLQLAKVEERQRRYASETQQQWQRHHYYRSVPDLNKQQYYLSVESKSAKSHFNSDKGKNFCQEREEMDPVYLSIPDLGMAVRPRPLLKAAIESIRNVTKMDTSWNLHGLCRKGRGEKSLQRHYESVSDYFRSRYRSAVLTVNAAAESTVKDIIDTASESSIKDRVDHGIGNSNDNDYINSNDDTVTSREVIQHYKSSVNDGSSRNKNDVISGGSDLIVHRSYIHDSRNNSGIDSGVENIKSDGRVNKFNNDYGKLAERFLRNYQYQHLNEYKKSDSVTKTDRNWSWKNLGDDNDNSINCRCYSLLNKPSQQKNCHRRHRSGDGRNTTFLFASTTSNNNNVKNIISKHQWYYYPSVMYSKIQQQLMDEMAKHIAECLEQFNTGLDKVLQARQLLETSQELPADDRETMLRLLNQAMRTSLKRMEYNDDRYEPDGRYSESPNSLASQRQCAPVQQLSNTNDGNASFHNITNNMDPAEFFQQHGQQLLALLQQNMAKQN